MREEENPTCVERDHCITLQRIRRSHLEKDLANELADGKKP